MAESIQSWSIPTQREWRRAVAKYEKPHLGRSLWQVANTIVPYLALWWLMVRSTEISYWLTLALAFPAAGFMVRTFILFHDCCHGSFFRSHRANNILGLITGVMTLTPYSEWRRSHSIHHATSGDLDRRGIGDVWTLTVREYQESSLGRRIWYRIFRSPLSLFVVGPVVLFLVWHRFPAKGAPRREKLSVLYTNIGIALVALAAWATIGLGTWAVIQGMILLVAGPVAIWLFYVQHQFEETYWEKHQEWEYIPACLQGSSFYKLPKILQWFSGNIGFHHIHHLSPRIPNYYLEPCHREHSNLLVGEPLTLWSSLRSFGFRLWDEDLGRMVGFRRLREIDAN